MLRVIQTLMLGVNQALMLGVIQTLLGVSQTLMLATQSQKLRQNVQINWYRKILAAPCTYRTDR